MMAWLAAQNAKQELTTTKMQQKRLGMSNLYEADQTGSTTSKGTYRPNMMPGVPFKNPQFPDTSSWGVGFKPTPMPSQGAQQVSQQVAATVATRTGKQNTPVAQSSNVATASRSDNEAPLAPAPVSPRPSAPTASTQTDERKPMYVDPQGWRFFKPGDWPEAPLPSPAPKWTPTVGQIGPTPKPGKYVPDPTEINYNRYPTLEPSFKAGVDEAERQHAAYMRMLEREAEEKEAEARRDRAGRR